MITWIRRWRTGRRLAAEARQVGYQAGLTWRYAEDWPAPTQTLHGSALVQWHRGFRLGHRLSLDEARQSLSTTRQSS